MTLNPFQAPSLAAENARVTGASGGAGSLYVDGDVVVAAVVGSYFPDRCVMCNEPAQGFKLDQKLFWHPRWVFFLVISPLIYVIAALITRKSAQVSVGLCDAHRRRRRRGRLIGGCILALGVSGCAVLSGARGMELLFLSSLLLTLTGFVTLALMARTVTPVRIDEREVRMKTGRAFLESLR